MSEIIDMNANAHSGFNSLIVPVCASTSKEALDLESTMTWGAEALPFLQTRIQTEAVRLLIYLHQHALF